MIKEIFQRSLESKSFDFFCELRSCWKCQTLILELEVFVGILETESRNVQIWPFSVNKQKVIEAKF